jgi:hypothetical protein
MDEAYGLSEKSINLLNSYLSGRKQCVKVKNIYISPEISILIRMNVVFTVKHFLRQNKCIEVAGIYQAQACPDVDSMC